MTNTVSISTEVPPTLAKQQLITETTEITQFNASQWLDEFRHDVEASVPSDLHSQLLSSFRNAIDGSQISMIPVYTLPKLTDSPLEGEFICLELGGSTFRAGVVDFSQPEVLLDQKAWIIPEAKKVINDDFFEYAIQLCLQLDSVVCLLRQGGASIAITWSFPTDDKNLIITMGKGWHLDQATCEKPLDQLFTIALEANGYMATVKSVVNDSVGTALSGLANGELSISLIVGTGVNACFSSEGVLMNSELGFFGGLEKPTKYDQLLDERWSDFKDAWKFNSQERIYQPFEMLTSGRHLCEQLRLIMKYLYAQDPTFPDSEFAQYELHGELFCLLANSQDTTTATLQLRKKYGLRIEEDQVDMLREVVSALLERSSVYITTAVKAIHQLTGNSLTDNITVTYIGSFLQHCHQYQRKIEEKGVKLVLIEDSSLIGGAVAAALETLRCY